MTEIFFRWSLPSGKRPLFSDDQMLSENLWSTEHLDTMLNSGTFIPFTMVRASKPRPKAVKSKSASSSSSSSSSSQVVSNPFNTECSPPVARNGAKNSGVVILTNYERGLFKTHSIEVKQVAGLIILKCGLYHRWYVHDPIVSNGVHWFEPTVSWWWLLF